MIIRKLEPDDDRMAVSHVYEESWKYGYKGLIPQEYLDSIPKGRWATRVDRPGFNALVMIDGDRIFGTSGYGKSRCADLKDFGEIISIYLLPEYIGKGYGRQLLKETVRELKESGFHDIYLWVLKGNYRARRFYEKYGFLLSDVYLNDNIGGRDLREIRYQLHLG